MFAVDEAAARRHSVVGVAFRRVAFFDGRGDAALRPKGRAAVSDGRGAKIATGVGASFSAQNTPASPPPMMRMGGKFSRIDRLVDCD
ncbi:hypothetical protein [Methylocystis rosea]|uniref:hypothetical protein n=1 Tax=Methylocystis rosea TaxID=173366 RepID=UPI001FF03EF3|nr:hypothetical protein [Methylocystis rosea]